MHRKAPSIKLLPRQRESRERLSRSRKVEQRVAERVQIVLGAAKGKTNTTLATEIGVDAPRVARWRSRFAAAQGRLAAVSSEDVADDKLEATILDILSDRERSGCPGKFTAEQLTGLIGLVCQTPKELGLCWRSAGTGPAAPAPSANALSTGPATSGKTSSTRTR